jgi:hypothetical protein
MPNKELEASASLEEIENDVDISPNQAADPHARVAAKFPPDVLEKYEIASYRNAVIILAEAYPVEFLDLIAALRSLEITTTMIRTAGGNESDIPKLLSETLRPAGWHETSIRGDLVVNLGWKEEIRKTRGGKPIFGRKSVELRRDRYLDGHKIDYVKSKVAFDLEWNSKDQTFDRDLYAFNAFFTAGAIDVGVLLTRGVSLNNMIKTLGPALKKNGTLETANGIPRPTAAKYGASTTWWGKLIHRLNAGRNAGCPVLAIGITPACVPDYIPVEKGT